MSNKMIGIIASVGILVFLGLFIVGSYISNYNYGNEVEKQLTTQMKQNENVLSSYYGKVQEIVQVNDMYKNDLKEVVTAAIQGRYGENGSQASWQWLKENNPSLDSSLYVKVQQVIEAGRNEFKNSQSVLLDMKRGYETNLGYFWKGTWLRIAGYPKINLDDIRIVVTEDASEAFRTGVDTPLQLRK